LLKSFSPKQLPTSWEGIKQPLLFSKKQNKMSYTKKVQRYFGSFTSTVNLLQLQELRSLSFFILFSFILNLN